MPLMSNSGNQASKGQEIFLLQTNFLDSQEREMLKMLSLELTQLCLRTWAQWCKQKKSTLVCPRTLDRMDITKVITHEVKIKETYEWGKQTLHNFHYRTVSVCHTEFEYFVAIMHGNAPIRSFSAKLLLVCKSSPKVCVLISHSATWPNFPQFNSLLVKFLFPCIYKVFVPHAICKQ